MTTHSSLLAYLAPRLAGGEENLATEALSYILASSPPARAAFVKFLSHILEQPLPELTFKTQAADSDGTIPDMVGLDANGTPIVYVEVKFWAGLTDSQPVGYLNRLQREQGEGLVFLAPANRLVTLWPELVFRCRDAEIEPDLHLESAAAADGSHRKLHAASFPPLALTSWNAVLAEILRACTTAGDAAAAEDVRQIQGLCSRMEESGFLPLRGEELTGNVPRRIADYCGLVDDVTTELVTAGLADISKLRSSAGRDYYLRYLLLKGNGGQIAFHWGRWANLRSTPLWVKLVGADWKPSTAIRDAVGVLLVADPPKAFIDDDGSVLVPLTLITGRERPEVLTSLVNQVKAICELIPQAQGSALPQDESV